MEKEREEEREGEKAEHEGGNRWRWVLQRSDVCSVLRSCGLSSRHRYRDALNVSRTGRLFDWTVFFFLVTEHGQSRQKVILFLGRLAIGTLEDEDGHTHTHTQIYDCDCF